MKFITPHISKSESFKTRSMGPSSWLLIVPAISGKTEKEHNIWGRNVEFWEGGSENEKGNDSVWVNFEGLPQGEKCSRLTKAYPFFTLPSPLLSLFSFSPFHIPLSLILLPLGFTFSFLYIYFYFLLHYA